MIYLILAEFKYIFFFHLYKILEFNKLSFLHIELLDRIKNIKFLKNLI
jgi:hypothetical protein